MNVMGLVKLVGRALGMPGTNPGYGDVALGHVAEELAKKHSEHAADDMRLVRDAKLAKPSADIAKSEAVVAKAAASAETDNIKKRAAAQKECESLSKKLEAAKTVDERRVLFAELAAAQTERMADAHDRFEAAKARLEAKGRKVTFDPENLAYLQARGVVSRKSLLEAKPNSDDRPHVEVPTSAEPIAGTSEPDAPPATDHGSA